MRKHHIWIAAVLLIAGCATTHPKQESAQELEQADRTLPSALALLEPDTPIIEQDYLSDSNRPWWTVFSEPALELMIDATIENSVDLAVANTRLREAYANRRATRQDLLPTVNLNGSLGLETTDLSDGGLSSGPSRTQDASLGLLMNWQLDIFGELRSAHASARAELESSEELVRDTQRVLVGLVAEGYYELAGVRERIRVAQDSINRRQINQERIEILLEKGYATTVDKARTDSQFYDARAAIAQLELDEITLLNQLSLLVGIGLVEIRELLATANVLSNNPVQLLAPNIDALLVHRPDLRSVERELVAAAYDVRTARRAQYPTLGLSIGLDKGPSVIDTTSASLPTLNSWASEIVSNLSAPILGRGRILAQIDAESARLERAHLNYENALRVALQGIDTSLASVIKSRYILDQRKLAATAADLAAEQSKYLYEAGEIDYTSVIVAEQTRAFSQDSVIVAHRNSLISYIQYTSAVAPAW